MTKGKDFNPKTQKHIGGSLEDRMNCLGKEQVKINGEKGW